MEVHHKAVELNWQRMQPAVTEPNSAGLERPVGGRSVGFNWILEGQLSIRGLFTHENPGGGGRGMVGTYRIMIQGRAEVPWHQLVLTEDPRLE